MKLELNINDEILKDEGLTEFDIRMIVGCALLNKVTSIGKTAEIVGVERVTFQTKMGNYGGFFELDVNELIKECEYAENF